MILHCLLVDDEPLALKVLESHIANVNGLEIVAKCKNAIEAIDVLHQKQVDLIFLDIKMPKLLGTDFIKNLSSRPKIIFVTGYREYAIEGYDLDAIDYLLKPVSFERFVKAVSKVKKIVGNEMQSHIEEYKANPEEFFYLKVDKNMQKVFINEIFYIESLKDYIKVFLTTGKYLLVRQSISSMEKLLSTHRFLRVHRSYIVSIDKITGFNNLFLKLNSDEIPIGKIYKQAVMGVINLRRLN
ncbi:MAG TPA: LytTR family DNA-binding domain-containing protein [Chitinophagaceae bacterium]|nr:LytTR family DNA-binding domain-containing protein [Chitinophagaceae bacterium]